MSKQRPHGDGALYWNEKRQRWVAEVTIGYDGRGKRVTTRRYRRTKTEAKDTLRDLLRDLADGLAVTDHTYTVGDAMADWLRFGLSDREEATRTKIRTLCETHIVPFLGARKLRDLKVQEVEAWLAGRAKVLAKSTLAMVKSYLNRAVRRAMAQDRVRRNVVELVTPTGRTGRAHRPVLKVTAARTDRRSAGTYPGRSALRVHRRITADRVHGPRNCASCVGITCSWSPLVPVRSSCRRTSRCGAPSARAGTPRP